MSAAERGKTADSGQIAKARERYARAEKFFDDNYDAMDGLDEISRAVRFAESERQAVIEDCAKVADRLSKNQTNIKHPQQRMTVEATAESIAAAIRSMGE